MWFLLLNLNFGSTKECLEIPRKPLFFSPIPSSPTPHYCVSHKYFFIKNRHSSLKGLLRIKKEKIEKKIKKLWNMRVVFLYFLLSSLLYHKNRIMCVCMYTRTHVWVRTHACKSVGRGLQYIRRVTQPPAEPFFQPFTWTQCPPATPFIVAFPPWLLCFGLLVG